jgi:hypothetical protein
MSVTNTAAPRPRSGTISNAVAHCGIGRSKLYELAAATPGLFRKFGKRVIVDFDVLDGVIDKLPNAEIAPPKPRTKPQPQPKRRRRRKAARA